MNQQHKQLKQRAQAFFKQTKSITSPAFPKEKIAFSSKGLSHLFYKGANKRSARDVKESETRVNLLPAAHKLLKVMALPQEESTLTNREGKVCKYWAFEAVVDARRIKVIVRQVGNGKKHFWSVIPAWRRIRGKVINAKGKLSED